MNAERPVDNAPYLSYVHNGLTIEGWSRAAVQSYWRIPELKLGFDLGAHPWDFMGTGTWLSRTRTWTTSPRCRCTWPAAA